MPAPSQIFPTDGISRSAQTIIATIPAASTRQFNVPGNYFYFVENGGTVWLKTDIGGSKPYQLGTGEIVPPGSFFRFLELENRSAASIDIELYIGFGEYIDKRLNIVRERPASVQPVAEQPTAYVASATVSIAATTAVVFTGTPATGQLRRKAIVISNRDTAASIVVRDDSNAPGTEVFPSTSITLPVSGEIEVYNPTGGAIAVYMAEIFYLDV